ncbi:putative membrane protein [Candidatus Protofrankia californiensis]|uniref:Putative membrane protein n=1 Tax=Candidatus Protofrankia californiensis TaxID=1839754 RepID=A0A1C3NZD8_9ACTN|nr:putative membrane protein [Candidatus Protofrankia californiensis]
MITAVTLISCCCAAWHTRQARFFAFTLHTFINIFLLLPLKAYAICTLSNANWGSRAIPAAAPGGYEERVPTAALPTQPGTAPAPDSAPATSPQPR